MKKIVLLTVILLTFISGCNNDVPVLPKIYSVTYKVTGTATDVTINIPLDTFYEHVILPYELTPFNVEKGSPVGYWVWDNRQTHSSMNAIITVDGNIFRDSSGIDYVSVHGIIE